jgi:hypothetical protein
MGEPRVQYPPQQPPHEPMPGRRGPPGGFAGQGPPPNVQQKQPWPPGQQHGMPPQQMQPPPFQEQPPPGWRGGPLSHGGRGRGRGRGRR